MRDYVKAIEAVQEAAEHDDAKAHAKEIQEQIWKCQQAQFAQREGESDDDVMQRAMRDPEVAVRFPSLNTIPPGLLVDDVLRSKLWVTQSCNRSCNRLKPAPPPSRIT